MSSLSCNVWVATFLQFSIPEAFSDRNECILWSKGDFMHMADISCALGLWIWFKITWRSLYLFCLFYEEFINRFVLLAFLSLLPHEWRVFHNAQNERKVVNCRNIRVRDLGSNHWTRDVPILSVLALSANFGSICICKTLILPVLTILP